MGARGQGGLPALFVLGSGRRLLGLGDHRLRGCAVLCALCFALQSARSQCVTILLLKAGAGTGAGARVWGWTGQGPGQRKRARIFGRGLRAGREADKRVQEMFWKGQGGLGITGCSGQTDGGGEGPGGGLKKGAPATGGGTGHLSVSSTGPHVSLCLESVSASVSWLGGGDTVKIDRTSRPQNLCREDTRASTRSRQAAGDKAKGQGNKASQPHRGEG
ncbi:hypothetical protein B0T11DRAFT_21377 [Plectosphaerella cucumerina]|uniref:Uncharacterized protein n=1 Tax=Plectosphaerella cucumerina TaxID=40658 RepID=A0A8K0X929_9PEZI|nr:hypothetical protein B0T11DRAFT_21377 [Plectosphaerella cucumerina]